MKMKKLLQHKWKATDGKKSKTFFICTKCGCLKEWDFHFSRYVFYFPNSKGVTFIRPDCKLPTFTKFPSENNMLVGGYDGGDFYKY